MKQDGSIHWEFDFALPPHQSPRYGAMVQGHASGQFGGRANPDLAIAAFDATRSRTFGDVAAEVMGNVQGWVQYALAEAFRVAVTEGDVIELVLDPQSSLPQIRTILEPQFSPWGLAIAGLEYAYRLDPSVIQALPDEARMRLAPSAVIAAVPRVTVQHRLGGDIPPVVDPKTGHELKVRIAATVTFTMELQQARATVDPQGDISTIERVQREAITKAEEWVWYAVKQSFYNWIYDPAQTERRFVRDYSLIHPKVLELCEEGLRQLGVNITEATVRYEALDPDTAWALTAPSQSTQSPPARPAPAGGGHVVVPGNSGAGPVSGEHEMAATIAAMTPEELMAHAGSAGNASGLPPIEEAVWRHQKRLRKNEPDLPKAESASRILGILRDEGYSIGDRQRIAKLIGARPEDITE